MKIEQMRIAFAEPLAEVGAPGRITARPAAPLAILPGGWLVVAALASAAMVALLLATARMTIDPWAPVDRWLCLGSLVAAGACYLYRAPRNRWQLLVRDAAEYLGIFVLICLLGAIASYPAAADSSGFVDPALERVDRLLHFDWIAWYDVVAAHPALQLFGSLAYQSIFVTPAVLLIHFACAGRRAEARLFIASFWLAAVVTLLLFSLMPAEGPLAFLWRGPIPYMPASALYQANLIPALRHHGMPSIELLSLHGLVCVPSFHTTSAFLYIAAAWPIRRLRWPILALNLAMLLATPVEGTHYLTDMIVGMLVGLGARAAMAALVCRLPQRGVG